jgi:hypothetical protein
LSNALEIVEPTASQAGSKETTMATAIQQLAGAQNGVIDKSVSAGNIVLASAEVYYNYRVNITGATVAGRTVTLPQKIRTFLMYSDSGNTQDISIIRGSTTIVLHPDTTYLVYTDGTANGLQAYVLAIGSAGGFFVPVGGASGYVLKKTSATDGAFAWAPDATSVNPTLTADTTFYVRTDGSDSNTGLVDSAGGAFLTIQKAFDYLLNTDLGGFTATIQVRDGTYTTSSARKAYRPFRNGFVKIVGNVVTPANVILQSSETGPGILFDFQGGCSIELAGGYTLQRSASNNLHLISADLGAKVNISGPVVFGAAGSGAHMLAVRGAVIQISASAYTISGSAASHMQGSQGGEVQFNSTTTVTLTGTPAFTQFVNVANNGIVVSASGTVTYSGAATGKRYTVATNGTIASGAGSETYFPGDTPGSKSTGGYYGSSATGYAYGINGYYYPTAVTADTTLDLTHTGAQLGVNSASDKTITVPPNSSVAFAIGTVIFLEQVGAGQIIVAAGAGVTINSAASLKSRTTNSTIRLLKTGTNTWTLSGDLEDVPVLYLFAAGVPTANEVLWVQKFAKVGFKLPASLTGSNATLQTAATASTTFTIKNNGSSIGTIVFGVGGTSATFTFSSAVVFAVNDVLTIVAPASPDATAAGLAISLKGG